MKKLRKSYLFKKKGSDLNFKKMKLTLLFSFLIFSVAWAESYSQTTRLSLDLEDASVKKFIQEVEDQTDFFFLYQDEVLDKEQKITIQVKNQSLEKVLKLFEEQASVIAEIAKDQIVLKKDMTKYSQSGMQQNRQINGFVSDQNGQPLPGVTVIVKGTAIGTITNADGEFSLSIPDDAEILQFSFVGMRSQEIPVEDRTTFTVMMEEETIGLEEVVAVGYGTMKKMNLTGSVESIDAQQIVKQPVAQASQALVGLTPGLTAIQSSGQPGLDYATLRIRGIGSIGASNNPLVLIDGVSGSLNNINPEDIADISVLKDAASASIYGSRASNGVILITTKRAAKQKLSINYRNYVGWQTPIGHPKVLNALDYLKYSGEDQAKIDEYAANMDSNPDEYPDTDWINLLFTEDGFQQHHTVSFNGGTDKVGILANISYVDQNGNILSYGYDRYNGRLNTDIKISDKFDVNFDLSFHKSLRSNAAHSLSLVTQQAYRIPSVYPAIYSDGSWADGWAGRNPVAIVNDGGYNNIHNNYFRGSLKGNYSIIPGLKLSVMYTPEYGDTYYKYFVNVHELVIDLASGDTRKVPDKNSLYQSNGRSFNDTFNALLSYSKKLKAHDFSVLAGYEFMKYQYETFSASRDNFILPNYQVLNAGSEENDANSGSATHSSLVSYFGRLNYAYNNRYLLEANIRRDASSRFSTKNRVAYFPSFSAGWRLNEEEFIKNLNLFSNLKLRASWGQLGNQQIGSDFPYASSISLGSRNHVFGNSVLLGATQNVLANENIKWETTETTNFGIDAGFFDQHLFFTLEYYVRKTKDILLNLPIPLIIGLSAPPQNAGNVENRGWDFSLTWQDKIRDFNYSINMNFADVKNEVTNLAGIGPIISGSSITEVGSPVWSIYGYESIGMFPDEATIASAPSQIGTLIPGNIRYKDQLTVDTNDDGIPDEADGRITADDRVIIGDPFPRMTFGINLDAAYKGFDLSLSLQGVGKRDVLLGGDYVWALFNAGNIQEWHTKECWTPDNLDAKYPIIWPTSSGSNDIQTSSTWVFDASYLKLRNITFGYTLPDAVLNKIFLEKVRLYFSGQNLFTIDNLPDGIDPLAPNGTHGGLYPVVRNLIIGIDVNF
jgi:TonB-linked SusC/RagA family outer membrane protein